MTRYGQYVVQLFCVQILSKCSFSPTLLFGTLRCLDTAASKFATHAIKVCRLLLVSYWARSFLELETTCLLGFQLQFSSS